MRLASTYLISLLVFTVIVLASPSTMGATAAAEKVSTTFHKTGTLVGRVVDAASGEGLPGANVIIEGTRIGAAADLDGNYRIVGVPDGTYEVTARFVGYQSVTESGVEIAYRFNREVNFELAEDASHLNAIIVSYERPLIENDAIGVPRVVSVEESANFPVRGVGSLPAVQGGVVRDDNSVNLSDRGGRANEVQYYVAGVKVGGSLTVNPAAIQGRERLMGVIPPQYGDAQSGITTISGRPGGVDWGGAPQGVIVPPVAPVHLPPIDWEAYAFVPENPFRHALDAPLSTFSIDVDRASYANVRRMLNNGSLPPAGAVRIEEFINYFDYQYESPDAESEHPFLVHSEVARAPWNPSHRIVRVALQGERIEAEDLPPANLTFLIDVSGSMDSWDKIDLLVQSFHLLVDTLRPEDRVAIVVYAGAAGVVLEPTPGDRKEVIRAALDRLRAGGSTAGGAGLRLAYRTARLNFDPAGNNRVILATDGDFNVGESSDDAMVRLIEEEREHGIFLSVLGFGTGNLQDTKMESVADHGNGNYSYIDSIEEAQRVFVRELGGTLFAIAKDVKIQVEFNPTLVASHRLIGYENRLLLDEEFNDDTRDAGELGAGHRVTALYEIIPHGVESAIAGGDPLRYQTTELSAAAATGELMTVKLRYKPATGPGQFSDESVLLSTVIRDAGQDIGESSSSFQFATAVAEFGLLMRRSEYAGDASLEHVLALSRASQGSDQDGDRAEFIHLVQLAAALHVEGRERQMGMRD